MIIITASAIYVLDDNDKFERIYMQYGRLMLCKAQEILHDDALSEDAVSEAFIRIYKNLHKLDDAVPSPRTASFAVTVVKNVALTMLKKQNYTDILPLEDTMQEEYSIEESVISDITAYEITTMFDSIGDDLKDVFLLYYEYDMSLKEIASALDITANTAAVRLHRARKKLAARLSGKGEGENGR